MTVNNHNEAYRSGKVDALVTFEPERTKLVAAGAKQLFDSSMIEGRIIDVLAVLPETIEKSPKILKKLVDAHFKALRFKLQYPDEAGKIIGRRMKLTVPETLASFSGLNLPDKKENLSLFEGSPSKLDRSAKTLIEIMQRSNLLNNSVNVENLFIPKFISDDNSNSTN